MKNAGMILGLIVSGVVLTAAHGGAAEEGLGVKPQGAKAPAAEAKPASTNTTGKLKAPKMTAVPGRHQGILEDS